MINEQSYELVQGNVGCGNSVVGELAVFDFVDHVLNLLLGGVVAHSSHQVWQLVNGHLFVVQLPGLSGVLLFGPDDAVVEEVVHVLERLALSAPLD